MQEKEKFGYNTFLLCLLIMLSAFGPFVTDMYLPALPQLQTFFCTSESMVQMTLSTSMIGLAVGQIFIGPLSDKFGRKPLLVISMWLFIISTVTCIIAPSIEVLIGLRFIQGVGGSGGIVLSRSIATDRYWGDKLSKMMAIIGTINVIAPVTAPIIGGMMTDSLSWRGIFLVLMGMGIILLICSYIMKESLISEKRSNESIIRNFASISKISRNPRFMNIWLQYGFCGGVFFAYLSSSPFIIQQYYGFSAFIFSMIFSFNALLLGIGSAISVRFKTPMQSTHYASIGIALSGALECIVMWMAGPFWLYEMITAIMLICIGMCFTSSTVVALNEERNNAGAASALIGAALFAVGGIVSPIVGIGTLSHTTGAVIVICGSLSLIFSYRSKIVLNE